MGLGIGLRVIPQLGQRRRHPALKRRDFLRIDFRRRDPYRWRSRLCCHNAAAGAESRFRRAFPRVALGQQCGHNVTNRFGFGTGGSNRFVGRVDPSPAYRTTLTAPPTLYPNPSTA